MRVDFVPPTAAVFGKVCLAFSPFLFSSAVVDIHCTIKMVLITAVHQDESLHDENTSSAPFCCWKWKPPPKSTWVFEVSCQCTWIPQLHHCWCKGEVRQSGASNIRLRNMDFCCKMLLQTWFCLLYAMVLIFPTLSSSYRLKVLAI